MKKIDLNIMAFHLLFQSIIGKLMVKDVKSI